MRIRLQTTIPFGEDDWHTDRFSPLTDECNDGHGVTARNLELDANGDDPVLAHLDTCDYERLWLFAFEGEHGAGGPTGHALDVDRGAPSFVWLKLVSE